jgi:glyoxylase-like metal-dependent hydrolase (beta-lactamase superfamily II)
MIACTISRKVAVIDPSWDGRGLARRVEGEGWSIDKILLTHAHFDHVGGLAELKSVTKAPIYIHPEAVPMLGMAEAAGRAWGFAIEPSPPPDEMLSDGQNLAVGELVLNVLYTPGHAPGHVCFYLQEQGVIFDGDVLFQGSIGRTDLPGGDYKLLMKSIQDKLLPLPDSTLVLSGHGSPTTIGDEKRWNPFLNG